MNDLIDTIDFNSPQTRRMLRDAENMPLVEPGGGKTSEQFGDEAAIGSACVFCLGVFFGVVAGFCLWVAQ